MRIERNFQSPPLSPDSLPSRLGVKRGVPGLNPISQQDNQENIPPQRKRRQIISFRKNLSPSTSNFDPQLVEEHASLRVQIFYAKMMTLHREGVRTRKKPFDVNFQNGPARLQHGRGKAGFHAAHADAFAGITENLRALRIHAIASERQITPNTFRFLEQRGFTEEQHERMRKSEYDEKVVEAVIGEIWPEQEGAISEDLNLAFNATDILPGRINLVHDRGLERVVRAEIPKLYKEVIMGHMSPENAVTQYVELIQNHFKKKIADVEKVLDEQLKKQDPSFVELHTIANTARDLRYLQAQLRGSITPPFHLFRVPLVLE